MINDQDKIMWCIVVIRSDSCIINVHYVCVWSGQHWTAGEWFTPGQCQQFLLADSALTPGQEAKKMLLVKGQYLYKLKLVKGSFKYTRYSAILYIALWTQAFPLDLCNEATSGYWGHFKLLQIYPWKEATPLITILSLVPRVAGLEGVHCNLIWAREKTCESMLKLNARLLTDVFTNESIRQVFALCRIS